MKSEFSFLIQRAEALASAMPAQTGESFRKTWISMLNQTAAAQPDLSSAELEKMEKEMDLFPRSVLGAEGMKKVEDGLFKSLGLRALGAQPRVVAKKVLKRGRVASEEERSILHDYLSEDSSRHELSQKEAKILDGILSKP